MEKQRKCDQLFLLVGSNPLPNLLATLVLKPESVRFFYSPETEKIKDLLRERLKAIVGEESLCENCIGDATDADEVRKTFPSISDGAHLHYTGGTKIMAVHARMAFRDAGGKDEHASYLDERKGVLRFDDGHEIDLSKQRIELTIDDILGLHEIEHILTDKQSRIMPTEQDSQAIASVVLNDPGFALKLYNIHQEKGTRYNFSEAKQQPLDLSELVDGLSIPQLPGNDWTEDTYKKWCKFLRGEWLETWCSTLVRGIVVGTEISVGVNCKRANGRELQIDMAVVRGHRLYVISCTTDTKIQLCKFKLFEVAMRARQLGGDLSRSALVSLLHGSNGKGAWVDQLRNDVADIWEASNTPQVFGLDDLKEWAGIDCKPDTSSLKDWLDS